MVRVNNFERNLFNLGYIYKSWNKSDCQVEDIENISEEDLINRIFNDEIFSPLYNEDPNNPIIKFIDLRIEEYKL